MVAKVITFGISKGGCSKTTSSGITAYLLSQEHKVLCLDMDGQGNLTSFLTGEFDICGVYEGKTTLEAIMDEDVSSYIVQITNNLHLVPSNDYLASLPRRMFEEKKGTSALSKALAPVLNQYDYIIIDTPPALSEHTILSLSASDSVVVMFDGSQFCYYAIDKFLEICEAARQKGNSKLSVAGILFSLIDVRAKENKDMIEVIDEEYSTLRFNTIIRRKATTRRLGIYGFFDNPELKDALENYIPFVKELKERVVKGQNPKEETTSRA